MLFLEINFTLQLKYVAKHVTYDHSGSNKMNHRLSRAINECD